MCTRLCALCTQRVWRLLQRRRIPNRSVLVLSENGPSRVSILQSHELLVIVDCRHLILTLVTPQTHQCSDLPFYTNFKTVLRDEYFDCFASGYDTLPAPGLPSFFFVLFRTVSAKDRPSSFVLSPC